MPNESRHVSDHLANERTLLAWVRTAVTLIGLGFVVARFSYFLRTLAAEAHRAQPPGSGGGTVLGILLIAAGGGTIGLALWRFVRTRDEIEQGDYRTGSAALLGLSIVTIIAAVAPAFYLGLTSGP